LGEKRVAGGEGGDGAAMLENLLHNVHNNNKRFAALKHTKTNTTTTPLISFNDQIKTIKANKQKQLKVF